MKKKLLVIIEAPHGCHSKTEAQCGEESEIFKSRNPGHEDQSSPKRSQPLYHEDDETTSKITQPVSALELKLWIAWFLHHCTWEASHLPASREITSCPDPAPIPNPHPPQSNEPHILFVSPQGCPLGGASFTLLPSHLPHAQALTEALDGFLLSPRHFLSHLRVCVELNLPELHRLCKLQKGLGK